MDTNTNPATTRRRIDGRLVWFTPTGHVATGADDTSGPVGPYEARPADCAACYVGRPHTRDYCAARRAD